MIGLKSLCKRLRRKEGSGMYLLYCPMLLSQHMCTLACEAVLPKQTVIYLIIDVSLHGNENDVDLNEHLVSLDEAAEKVRPKVILLEYVAYLLTFEWLLNANPIKHIASVDVGHNLLVECKFDKPPDWS